MSDIAIRVEGLSKRYRIGVREQQPQNLRQALKGLIASPFAYLQRTLREPMPEEVIWALKGVSFEVKRGEVVGIIGRNGAGKTTLLKILSRITEPTEGYAEIHGRVGSLLEVGTGFHLELTGRENIYLNGAILGMKKAEIDRKFDEIVAFAETEKFIDTPVKRYSSGMYVRLAFAVAAHLEPEILLVDEVLSVGDVAFQKKCLGKIGAVAKEGRTVLFVSHNMAAISQLCEYAVWLEQGAVREIAKSNQVVSNYLLTGASTTGRISWTDNNRPPGDNRVRLVSMTILDADGHCTSTVDRLCPFEVQIEYEVMQNMPSMRVGFQILSPDGTIVLTAPDTDAFDGVDWERRSGHYMSICEMPGEFLNANQYVLRVGIDIPGSDPICLVDNALQLYVVETAGMSGTFQTHPGLVYKRLPWRVVDLKKG